jgi:hypothetical protein
MLSAIAIAVGFAAVAVLSLVRLRPLHPVQLWTIPWAIATGAFALRLLPYRGLSGTTVAVIVGGSVAFIVGAFTGERLWPLIGERWRKRRVEMSGADRSVIEAAGTAALLITLAWLAVFLVDLAHDHGVRATLVSSKEVRGAIEGGAGLTPFTVKYVYVAIGGSALNALAAVVGDPTQRMRYAGYAAACVATTYFSTGRATIVLAALVALVTAGLAWHRLRRRTIVAAVLAVALASLVVLVGGGSLIGKTFENNEISTIDSVFTRHKALESLALPYQYVSAPIAALNVEISTTPTWGRAAGCASLSPACTVFHPIGLAPPAEPHIRPFTGAPLPWNTYTALDNALLDGGLALFAPIMLLTGVLLGLLWAFARTGSAIGLLVYGIEGAATVFSAGQSVFLAPHMIGAILAVLVLVAAMRRWPGLRPSFGVMAR